MKNSIQILTAFLLLFFGGFEILNAHPGHGDTEGQSLIHYLSEPLHIMVVSTVILVLVFSFTYIMMARSKESKRTESQHDMIQKKSHE